MLINIDNLQKIVRKVPSHLDQTPCVEVGLSVSDDRASLAARLGEGYDLTRLPYANAASVLHHQYDRISQLRAMSEQ